MYVCVYGCCTGLGVAQEGGCGVGDVALVGVVRMGLFCSRGRVARGVLHGSAAGVGCCIGGVTQEGVA